MKLKIVVVDLEIPRPLKKWMLRVGIPVAVLLGGGAIAWAAGLHTWSTGDTLQAADLNGNFTNLQQQITTTTFGSRTPSAFQASLQTTTTVTIAPNTNTTVPFDLVDHDLANEYNKSTGVFTAAAAGVYLVHCGIEFDGSSGTAVDWAVMILKNGGQAPVSDSSYQVGTGQVSLVTDWQVQLAVGDTLACAAFQSSNSAVNLSASGLSRNTFSAVRLY